jgi:hypothetical protein
MRDVEELALAMPSASRELRDDDRQAFIVDHKLFCFHRTKRRDATDALTGKPLDDVLVFRAADEEMKSMWLAGRPSVHFTTDHFDGHPWILMGIPSLADIERDELFELVSDAWLARAPKRLARTWLEEHGTEPSLARGRAAKAPRKGTG